MAGNPKCSRYREIDAEDKPNCINCYNWIGDKCKLHDQLAEDTKEIEGLMKHDAYRRERGVVKQVRRG